MNPRFLTSCALVLGYALSAHAEFQAGSALVDVTPKSFPVLVNGGMLSREASTVSDPIMARAIVLADGNERAAIVIADSCMMPRPLLDKAKKLAAERTQISPDRILIAATHTHTAPASMGCLGTSADLTYSVFLVEKLAEAIAQAEANLQPAQIGWASVDAPEFTALRRWIRRPDRVAEDPFGNLSVRANMHAGRNWDDVTGESGPEDPELSIIAIQSTSGTPIALLANFSMHYFGGVKALSSDYFGIYANWLQEKIGPDSGFVAMMSHGCSGDIWRRDYTERNWTESPKPAEEDFTVQSFAEGLAEKTLAAYKAIQFQADVDLSMDEARPRLAYRVPDRQRLEWAERIVGEMGDRKPKTRTEVYAREQLILYERQSTEIVVQALRVGDIAIATTPNETYALTGLKLKLQSPVRHTMVIELANGGDGYIPPPEQHFLGGYNTWAARSAGLEVQAEPIIVETALQLLENVSGQSRRVHHPGQGPLAQAIVDLKPDAYWRFEEFAGPNATDNSGNNRDGLFEEGVAFHLAGPDSARFCENGAINRCAHFAGGRMAARVAELGADYTASLWIWNGLPTNAREVTGWFFSRGRDHGLGPLGDHLGIGGSGEHEGKLIYLHGNDAASVSAGAKLIDRWAWNHVALVRKSETVRIYLNGELEIETQTEADFPTGFDRVFIGGRCDRRDNWEGRLDEIAIYKRALSKKEINQLTP